MTNLLLSEALTDTMYLDTNKRVQCDLTVSTALLESFPSETRHLFETLHAKLSLLWQALALHIPENPWIERASSGGQVLSFSVILVTNSEIQQMNQQHRGQDRPTDVLTFPVLNSITPGLDYTQLPAMYLGEVVISLEWAREAVLSIENRDTEERGNFLDPLGLYMMERLIHGWLHLLERHHDTMAEYNNVVAIQQEVLRAVTG